MGGDAKNKKLRDRVSDSEAVWKMETPGNGLLALSTALLYTNLKYSQYLFSLKLRKRYEYSALGVSVCCTNFNFPITWEISETKIER